MVDDLGEIVSAGFCDYYNGKIECWGYSVTCNVGARPEKDAMLIQEAIEAGKVSIIHGFDGLPEIATNEPFGDTVGFAELLKYKVL
jgi:hypothetical protein